MSNRKQNRKVVVAIEPSRIAIQNSPNTQNSNSPMRRKRGARYRKQKKAASQQLANQLTVQPCTKSYLLALADPWHSYKIGADICLPDGMDVPSFKFSFRSRLIMTIGTNGLGGVALNPAGCGNGANTSVIGYSTASFAGTVLPNTAGAVGWNFQGSSSILLSGIAQRCVVLGLRARYTGTELNRGGQLICYRGPPSAATGATDNAAGTSPALVLARNRTDSKPVDRDWSGVVYTPTAPIEREYLVVNSTFDLTANNGNWDMAILATGTPGNTFEVDIVGFYEAISTGNSFVPSVSASDSDLPGYSFVRDVYARMADSDMGQAVWDRAVLMSKGYLANAVTLGARSMLTM